MPSRPDEDPTPTSRERGPIRADWIDRLQQLAEAERQANPEPLLQESPESDEMMASVRAAPAPE